MGNKNLNKAQQSKKDEFYTLYEDIEKELINYDKKHFKNKIVYCNTDKSNSNFVRLFKNNFNNLQLKTLINSCIDGYVEFFDGYNTIRKSINGDFRSRECVNLLYQSDIVVTNPPFSLFKEYMNLIIRSNKKFLVMGNNNALTYTTIFPHIQKNNMWVGCNYNKTLEFKIPNEYEKYSRIDEDGQKYARVPAVSWFTNIPHQKQKQKIILTSQYQMNEKKYPKYDNYDAIEVSRVSEIPIDYPGVMGVPVTFLNKFNPDQFEVVGATESEGVGFSNGLWDKSSGVRQPLIDGKRKYKRVFIKHIK